MFIPSSVLHVLFSQGLEDAMRQPTAVFQHNSAGKKKKEKVFAWMRANDLTYERIGERLGVIGTGVSRMFTKPSIPTRRYKQLLDVGVPRHLLPPTKDIPTDPPQSSPRAHAGPADRALGYP